MIREKKSPVTFRRVAVAFAAVFILGLSGCGYGSKTTDSGTVTAAATSNTASSAVAMAASNYMVPQSAGSVSVTVARTGGGTDAVSVAYNTADGTAVAGADYTATSGTLNWAENDSTSKTISIPVVNATPFAGDKQFNVALTDPSASTAIGSPGSAAVTITGDATPAQETVELADSSYNVAQSAGSLMVSVNRTGGSAGAVSVGYVTANATALAGKDYTTTTGTLQWADGDAAAKTFSIPISKATPFSGNKTFTMQLTNASGAAIAGPSSATVTIAGDASPPVGSVQLSASSFVVAQNGGSVALKVTRLGGSSGAVSVAYATANGTAVAGTNFTATSGTMNWATGDASSKTISVPISNATPFSGSKTFTVALSGPAGGATIASPGSATVSISGDAATSGNLQLSGSSYSIAQSAGSVTVSVSRTGGSSGAVGVSYATANGTAVSGTDYTNKSGTLQWASGDATAKTISIPISNATAFSGNKSFKIALSAATGGAAVGSPSSATVSITGDAAAAAGSLQLSAAGYSIAESGGSLSVTVNRTGGSNGAISVAYATANGTATAGTDYTSASGTLNWASGDAASKMISIPVSNATPYSGSKTLTVALSSPAGGATLSTPNSATVTIIGSQVAPAGSTLWVYYNGVFNWGGDWSFAATLTYLDVTGAPLTGPFDILVTSQQWGGWQPFVSGNCQSNISQCFNTTPYKYVIFSAKPTVANQNFNVGFMSSGDTPDGTSTDTASYCSGGGNPAVGQWESCKIPLSVFGLTDTTILKFWISDQTGLSSNHWYLDNVGFSVN
jgi:Calx-beta domain